MTWTGTLREFRQIRGRKHIQVWAIQVDGAVETTWHGMLGGKLQSTSHTYDGVNKGKANELLAEMYSLERAARKVEMKQRAGYRECTDGELEATSADAVIPGEPLPQNLGFYKPSNSLGAKLTKKANAGKAMFTRKRDGMMYLLRTTEDEIEFYSRRMLRSMAKEDRTWEERLPHIYEEALNLLLDGVLKPHSILLGELVAEDDEGQDDFRRVAEVVKSFTEKALTRQAETGWLHYYIWDVAFWDGEPVCSTEPYSARLGTIQEICTGGTHLLPVAAWSAQDIWNEQPDISIRGETATCSKRRSSFPTKVYTLPDGKTYELGLVEQAKAVAQMLEWEGWVIIDPTGSYGDRAFNFRGKADRPSEFCGKLKPSYEDDFIAYWDPDKGIGTYGSGKFQKQVGSLALYQLNSDCDEVYISDVGGGLSNLDRVRLADTGTYPLTVQVEYDSRSYSSKGDRTNALRFPRVVIFRDDKDPEECVNAEL
jgi:ATP-dependent DNA ligase